jgi:hypothetical protein
VSARAAAAVALALSLVLSAGRASAQDVEARLDRSRIALGETTTLRVTARGGGDVRTPVFDLPDGITQVTSGRQQSFSWVNGRASSETEFQFELMGEREGTYSIGPIAVSVGSKSFRSGQLSLTVLSSLPTTGESTGDQGGVPAWLSSDVRPANPYVGQELMLRVRLMQRVGFAEDPQYVPPPTTGFWSDRPTAPESYYAQDRGGRVLVTETHTRLYPLAVGEATIGEATALVVLEDDNPLAFLAGGRQRLLKSPGIPVRVRPLPPGAPAGFSGAVGNFQLSWTADRARTSRDVPITVRLDVRGKGNLPLVRTPSLAGTDYEVFASTVDDSLGPPGSVGPGRKRFQWTLLPRHEGTLSVQSPEFSWFDPTAETYRRAPLSTVRLDVTPPLFTGAGAEGGFPRELIERPASPLAPRAQAWGFALSGLGLGLAARWWARGGRPAIDPARAEAASLRAQASQAQGPEFWRAAEAAIGWLQSHGKVADSPEWRDVRTRVQAARYGGGAGDESAVRRAVVEQLRGALGGAGARVPKRLLAVLLALAALGACFWFGPRGGDERTERAALAADTAARRGDLELARRGWEQLWNGGGHDARLAARIAWVHAQAGEIGPAALWVMRGELADPRESSLQWVEAKVREGGGLIGATPARLPVRPFEWSLLALLAGSLAVWLWGRRMSAAVVLALVALFAATIDPAQGRWAARSGRAVVLERAFVAGSGGSGVQLDAGEMVRMLEQRGNQVQIEAGRVATGWVAAQSVGRVVPLGANP